MTQKLEGKKVRFIAVDRKYRAEAYQAIAPLDSKLNTYITGQHIDPSDKNTKGNLTLKEITGDKDITPESRLRLFPHVINDVDPVMIIHNKEYNCEMDGKTPANYKDYVEANFIILQPFVAMSKQLAKPRHKFYLEDKDADAAVFVNNSDAVYEAEKLIREQASIEDYKDLVMMLNLSVTGFNINASLLTDTRLKEILLKQASTDPNSITKAFTSEGKDILFIAKLVDAKIITYKVGNGYYDGQKFLARDIDSLVSFFNDGVNSSIVGKFGTLLTQTKE
jgi:hypothetical protein